MPHHAIRPQILGLAMPDLGPCCRIQTDQAGEAHEIIDLSATFLALGVPIQWQGQTSMATGIHAGYFYQKIQANPPEWQQYLVLADCVGIFAPNEDLFWREFPRGGPPGSFMDSGTNTSADPMQALVDCDSGMNIPPWETGGTPPDPGGTPDQVPNFTGATQDPDPCICGKDGIFFCPKNEPFSLTNLLPTHWPLPGRPNPCPGDVPYATWRGVPKPRPRIIVQILEPEWNAVHGLGAGVVYEAPNGRQMMAVEFANAAGSGHLVQFMWLHPMGHQSRGMYVLPGETWTAVDFPSVSFTTRNPLHAYERNQSRFPPDWSSVARVDIIDNGGGFDAGFAPGFSEAFI